MIGTNLLSLPLIGEVSFGVTSWISLVQYLVWGLIIGVGLVALIKVIHDKIKYVYWGEVYKRRQDDYETGMPKASIVSGKAGYFTKRNGMTVYRIKYGLMPWQQIELLNLPDPEHMVGNKAFFFGLNKDNYVQAKISINWNKGEVKLEPVEDGMKFAAMVDLNEKDRIFEAKKISPVVIGMTIMGLILITGIVVFYFLSKAGA